MIIRMTVLCLFVVLLRIEDVICVAKVGGQGGREVGVAEKVVV